MVGVSCTKAVQSGCKKLYFYFLPIFRQSSANLPPPIFRPCQSSAPACLQPALIRADRQGLLVDQVERLRLGRGVMSGAVRSILRPVSPQNPSKKRAAPSCSYSSYSSDENRTLFSAACASIGHVWGRKGHVWGRKGHVWGKNYPFTGHTLFYLYVAYGKNTRRCPRPGL